MSSPAPTPESASATAQDKTLALLRELGDNVQVALMAFEVSPGGDAVVAYANAAACATFGYPGSTLEGDSSRSMLPMVGAAELDIAARVSTPTWTNWDGKRLNGAPVPVGASVARLRDGASPLYVTFLRDRTDSVASAQKMTEQVAAAKTEREAYGTALADARERLFVERKLSAQVGLVRSIWMGTMGLVVLVAVLVVVGWATGKYEKDSLAMFERILLVLAGMLGTAVAAIFDKQRGSEPPAGRVMS